MTSALKETVDMKYYDVLGVPWTADASQIKRAYFVLARKYHPDKIPKVIGTLCCVASRPHASNDEGAE
jgi:preprotein translocase subunit Sec63